MSYLDGPIPGCAKARANRATVPPLTGDGVPGCGKEFAAWIRQGHRLYTPPGPAVPAGKEWRVPGPLDVWIGMGVYSVPRCELPSYRRVRFGDLGFEGDSSNTPSGEWADDDAVKRTPYDELYGWHLDDRTGMPTGRPKYRQPSAFGLSVVRERLQQKLGYTPVPGRRHTQETRWAAAALRGNKTLARSDALAIVLGVTRKTIADWRNELKKVTQSPVLVRASNTGWWGTDKAYWATDPETNLHRRYSLEPGDQEMTRDGLALLEDIRNDQKLHGAILSRVEAKLDAEEREIVDTFLETAGLSSETVEEAA